MKIDISKEEIETVKECFHNKPLYNIGNYKFILNSLTEQHPATEAFLLKSAAKMMVKSLKSIDNCNKLLSEEDKGGILLAAISLLTNTPFGMARWYPSSLVNQIPTMFSCEYITSKELYLTGINKKDKVIIIDDIISTGGTLIGLIQSLEKIGAEILEILVLGEKIEYGGIAKIKKETSYDVKSIIEISIASELSKVVKVKI